MNRSMLAKLLQAAKPTSSSQALAHDVVVFVTALVALLRAFGVI